jgi:hypothetical protein
MLQSKPAEWYSKCQYSSQENHSLPLSNGFLAVASTALIGQHQSLGPDQFHSIHVAGPGNGGRPLLRSGKYCIHPALILRDELFPRFRQHILPLSKLGVAGMNQLGSKQS